MYPKSVYPTKVSPELHAALTACDQAGEILKKYWNSPPADFQTKEDSHYDLVSVVDQAVDQCISSILTESFPADRILSEELNPQFDDIKACKKRLWVVDPLDGTSGFLFRTDPNVPSVMIALMDEERATQLSVVYQPLVEQWTVAVRGGGAWMNGLRVQTRAANLQESAWVDMNHYGDVAYESRVFSVIDTALRSPGGARLVTRTTPSSAMALRLIDPTSKLSACIHDHNPVKPKQLPWDIIPIQLIVEEAGGLYVDAGRGVDAPLDPFDLKGPIIIGNRCIVEELAELVRDIETEP
jgi:fructose-1,6-bisphosphatase/inositol monophosphatase family enzyme